MKTLHFLFRTIRLLDDSPNARKLAQHVLPIRKFSVQQALHIFLEPMGSCNTGVIQSCCHDQFVMRKDWILSIVFVALNAFQTVIAPVRRCKIDGFCKVELPARCVMLVSL